MRHSLKFLTLAWLVVWLSGCMTVSERSDAQSALLRAADQESQLGHDEQAATLFRRAAAQGDVVAGLRVSTLDESAPGKVVDPILAAQGVTVLDEVTALAESGDVRAQRELGHYYMYGADAKPKDGFTWFVNAYKNGADRVAAYEIGEAFEKGRGVRKNTSKAVVWYKTAAELGHAMAMSTLGEHYYRGEGMTADLIIASEWFMKSALAGADRSTRELNQYIYILAVESGLFEHRELALQGAKLLEQREGLTHYSWQTIAAAYAVNGWFDTALQYQQRVSSSLENLKGLDPRYDYSQQLEQAYRSYRLPDVWRWDSPDVGRRLTVQ